MSVTGAMIQCSPWKSVPLREYEYDLGHDSMFPTEKCFLEGI